MAQGGKETGSGTWYPHCMRLPLEKDTRPAGERVLPIPPSRCVLPAPTCSETAVANLFPGAYATFAWARNTRIGFIRLSTTRARESL